VIPELTLLTLGGTTAGATLLRRARQRGYARTLHLEASPGVREAGFVELGGLPQWVSLRGERRDNPILLILHGGPGSTYSPMAPRLRSWERHFTVVQWDQRGAGKTFGKNGKTPLTFERLVADGLELIDHLCHRLAQSRLILLGSSVGSITGLRIAKRRPERLHAYVGTDQNVGLSAAGLERTLAHLRATGDQAGARALAGLGPDPATWSRAAFDRRNRLLVRASPGTPNMVTQLLLPSLLTSPEHSLGDVLDFFRGLAFSGDQLFDELRAFDARALGPRFELPCFVFQGAADWLTPVPDARAFFEQLEAPRKDFALVEGAGHLAAFARPQRFLELLLTHVLPAGQRE
jgi:pimeloyl-ACP methyl ester carboxylesterase